MKQHSHRYLPDLPSRILFLVFCAIYFLRFGQALSISKPLVDFYSRLETAPLTAACKAVKG
jgi:hypothetical protein